jgi:putative hydrolase of the HAD superfamily
MTTLPTAILFDLDDTILRFSASGEDCWRDVCEKFAPRVENVTAPELFHAIRARAQAYWTQPDLPASRRLDLPASRREHVAESVADLGIQDPEFARDIADTFTASRDTWVAPFPGAVETLAALRERGVRMGLITNGAAQPQWAKIDRFDLAQFFGVIVVEGEFGVGKPDPRVYHHAMAQLDVTVENTWVVGDNFGWEVEAPQALGMKAVWCDHRREGIPAHETAVPDRIVTAISELLPAAESQGESQGES